MRRLASVVGGFVPGHLCAEASVEGQTPASLQSWGPCLTPLSTGDQARGKKDEQVLSAQTRRRWCLVQILLPSREVRVRL